MILTRAENNMEAYLGEERCPRQSSPFGLLHRCPAPGHQGCRQDRGLGSQKRIINEPTAAALSYGIDKETDQKGYGIRPGWRHLRRFHHRDGRRRSGVLATAGNNRLGGDDFDQVMDWIVGSFKAETGVDLKGDKMAMQRGKEAAERQD